MHRLLISITNHDPHSRLRTRIADHVPRSRIRARLADLVPRYRLSFRITDQVSRSRICARIAGLVLRSRLRTRIADRISPKLRTCNADRVPRSRLRTRITGLVPRSRLRTRCADRVSTPRISVLHTLAYTPFTRALDVTRLLILVVVCIFAHLMAIIAAPLDALRRPDISKDRADGNTWTTIRTRPQRVGVVNVEHEFLFQVHQAIEQCV